MNRNQFLKVSSLAGVGLAINPLNSCGLNSKPMKLKSIGLGLFSVPKLLENDLEEAIKILSEMGITEFETYGPYTFSDDRNKASWAAVTPQLGFSVSGLYGKSASEFKTLLSKYNITVPSMHTDLYTLEEHLGELAEAANALGAKYVVLPSIPDHERPSIDAYKTMASRFNKIGEQAKKEGISFAYHNHGYGLQPDQNGVAPIDYIFNGTDPDSVFFEMDLFWTVAGKANPEQLLAKHSGRFKMLHIKDMRELSFFSGDGSTPDQWMALFPQLTSAGSGVMDLKNILNTAMQNGVDHYFIEHDFAPDPIKNIGDAAVYLKNLEISI